MRAAIYARKSTEQNVAQDAESVTLQVELARAFVTKHGWTVADDQVYVDDAISAAHYLNRDGLNRLLAAAKAKPRPYERAGLLSDLLDGGGARVRNEPRRSGRGYTG